AACEQSGRTRLPRLEPVLSLADWLRACQAADPKAAPRRHVLSLRTNAATFAQVLHATLDAPPGGDPGWLFLSGPEGGLSEAEETLARAAGWVPLRLGERTLRAETAPLAALAALSALF
ncbi:MAG TPA: RsmE family RNA methyltransferase, partial [Methylibium sp.]